MTSSEVWYQVDLPYACFSIACRDGKMVTAAPIGSWMKGSTLVYIRKWVQSKGGKIVEMVEEDDVQKRVEGVQETEWLSLVRKWQGSCASRQEHLSRLRS